MTVDPLPSGGQRLVLDASAALRLLEGLEAAEPYREAVAEADLVLAPELMLTEVANALWRLQRSGQLERPDMLQRFRAARQLVDVIEPDRTLQEEALALAAHLDHPFYDCLYLVLARRHVARLLSADRRLLTLAQSVLP